MPNNVEKAVDVLDKTIDELIEERDELCEKMDKLRAERDKLRGELQGIADYNPSPGSGEVFDLRDCVLRARAALQTTQQEDIELYKALDSIDHTSIEVSEDLS